MTESRGMVDKHHSECYKKVSTHAANVKGIFILGISFDTKATSFHVRMKI